jgi:hypothetical protein
MNCPLCSADHQGLPFYIKPAGGATYYDCSHCQLIWLDSAFHLNESDEEKRYREHNNDVTDPRYQNFVKPLCDRILEHHNPDTGAIGLDFGAGTGPVLALMLRQKGFEVDLYDCFFHNDLSVFDKQYDFIAASEVFEHFFSPGLELKRLRTMLRPSGTLGIMTDIFQAETDFASWYYHRDPTHVSFYRAQTFDWIKEHFHFSECQIYNKRQILFKV